MSTKQLTAEKTKLIRTVSSRLVDECAVAGYITLLEKVVMYHGLFEILKDKQHTQIKRMSAQEAAKAWIMSASYFEYKIASAKIHEVAKGYKLEHSGKTGYRIVTDLTDRK